MTRLVLAAAVATALAGLAGLDLSGLWRAGVVAGVLTAAVCLALGARETASRAFALTAGAFGLGLLSAGVRAWAEAQGWFVRSALLLLAVVAVVLVLGVPARGRGRRGGERPRISTRSRAPVVDQPVEASDAPWDMLDGPEDSPGDDLGLFPVEKSNDRP